MSLTDAKALVEILATMVGIIGGLLALYKYFSDRRENELREWQKVVIYKIFRQDELKALRFTNLLEKYRSEAQAFVDVNLRKKEISEDALRRVLLELASSGILSMEPSDSFRLNVVIEKPDLLRILNTINGELVRMVGANPYMYTLDEVVKEIAPKVGVEIPLLKNDLRQSIAEGRLQLDEQGRLAFPR